MRKTEVKLIDDIDGSEAAETVLLGLDHAAYEIDLSAGHAAELREALAEFTDHGRKVKAQKTAKAGRPPSDAAEVRRWAREHGYSLPDRGRIPHAVLDAYQRDHG